MKIYPLLVAVGILVAGCDKPVEAPVTKPVETTEVVKGLKSVTLNGATYVKIAEAHDNYVELWQKVGDEARYYTPSLDYILHPEGKPSFSSILR